MAYKKTSLWLTELELKEGLGKEMGMMWENGNLEWWMVGVL